MIQIMQEKLLREYTEWKKVIFLCFFLSVLGYGAYIVNITYATDDYCFIFSKINHIGQGRWFAGFLYNNVFDGCFMPTLSPFFSIVCYIFTGIGLCKLWKIKKHSRLLVIALWTLHPYFLDLNNFRIASNIGAMAWLIAISSLLIAQRGKAGFLFAVVLFYLALSTYQVVLGFAVSAVMMQMLFLSYRGRFSKKSLFLCRKYLWIYGSLFLISVVIYFSVNKLIFLLTDAKIEFRVEAGFLSGVDQLYPKICSVVKILAVRLLPVGEYVLPLTGKLLMLVIYIGGLFSLLKRFPKRFIAFFSVLWIALIPVGAISFILPLSVTYLPWRVCSGLIVFFVGMFALTQMARSTPVRKAGFWAGIFLVIYFILVSNTVWYKQYLLNQKDLFMANRMVSKIQILEGYRPGMELAILGKYQGPSEFKPARSGRRIQLIEDITQISSTEGSFNLSAFSKDWSKYCFLLNYLDTEFVQCSDDNLRKSLDASRGRNAWPDPSSIFIHDGVIVIVLSDPASN